MRFCSGKRFVKGVCSGVSPSSLNLTSLLYSENSACASFEEEIGGEVIKMLSPGVSAFVGTMSKVSRRLLPSPLLSQWPFTSVCWGFLGGVVVERLVALS